MIVFTPHPQGYARALGQQGRVEEPHILLAMDAAAALATLGVMWLPGAVLSRLLALRTGDRVERLATQLALGVSFWPLLFLLTTSAGAGWTATSARIVFAMLAIALAAGWMRRRRLRSLRAPDALEWTAIGAGLLVAITRWLHVRGIVWPLWVDSVHHTMIVRLLLEQGTVPASYAPFIEESTFFYHWGFHAFVAFAGWIGGVTAPPDLPRLLLVAGQVLNVAIFPAVYAGAKALLRDRRAALLAGVLATLVSWFPAYYVSWGRYTQLCGLLILPPLTAALWQLGRRPTVRRAIIVVILAGGLLLIHVRVAAVFSLLAAILIGLLAMQRRWRGVQACIGAGIVALCLVSPWMVRLARAPQTSSLLAPSDRETARWETPNGVPADLAWAPHNLPLYVIGSGGLFALLPFREIPQEWRVAGVAIWLALVALLYLRGRRRRRGIRRRTAARLAIIAIWIVVTAAIINAGRLGIPRLRIVPNSAAVIMLFLPLSIAAAEVIRFAADAMLRPAWRRTGVLVLTGAIAVYGAATMRSIVNPQTVLVTRADRDALLWIRAHTPRNARFAVGVQPWLAESFIGVDGGYWIPLVSDRASILPPGLYPWVVSASRADAVARVLSSWYVAQQRGDTAQLADLHRMGVTHVFFGQRNGSALRGAIASDDRVRRVYERDGVAIYALR